jgi:hypothetical protein
MMPSQYHHPPSILTSYFHKLIFILLPTILSVIQIVPSLHKTSICVRVSYPSWGLHVQHFTTSPILRRKCTFNVVSLRSILKCPLRSNSCCWFSRTFVVRHFQFNKINTFWPDTPCNFEDRYQHFGGNCRITEDGSRKLSRNTDIYFLNYTASRFRRL